MNSKLSGFFFTGALILSAFERLAVLLSGKILEVDSNGAGDSRESSSTESLCVSPQQNKSR